MMLAPPAPTKWDWNFRVMGIPVAVNPWFWVVCFVLGPGMQRNPSMVNVVIWIVVIFVSILVHELGHALSGRKFGLRRQRIYLYSMGGLAASDGQISEKKHILMILAGPAAGIALGMVTYLVGVALNGGQLYHPLSRIPTSNPMIGTTIIYLLWINLLWSLVNLIPVFPLDGGQVAFTGMSMHNRRSGPANALRLSVVAGIIVATLGIVKGYFFIAIMFAFLAYQSYQLISQAGHMGRAQEPDPADWWRDGRR